MSAVLRCEEAVLFKVPLYGLKATAYILYNPTPTLATCVYYTFTIPTWTASTLMLVHCVSFA
jgi:hypothetical protein